jgi:hypothetical protein
VTIPPGGVDAVKATLTQLSDLPTPGPRDQLLVTQLARSFRIDQDTRRRIREHPYFRNGFSWEFRDHRLKLTRAHSGPLWSAEIILHFEREDWAVGIPAQTWVRFARHGTLSNHDANRLNSVIDVYDVAEFKGLEADAILYVIDGALDRPLESLYVGISRARHSLALVIDASAAAVLPKGIREKML